MEEASFFRMLVVVYHFTWPSIIRQFAP